MIEWLNSLEPIYIAVLAGCFTWGLTLLGAATVFFFKEVNKKVMNICMGFAAGVMIAACFWSLIAPAIDLSNKLGYIEWLYPMIGVLLGGLFVVLTGLLLDKSSQKKTVLDSNAKAKNRSILLVTSITLHNIPEGLCVGVAVGAFALNIPGVDLIGALLLALGIGLQNFPEGAAVSLPLRADGMSRKKAFFLGQASGAVELVAAVIGFYLASTVEAILPFMLCFSAGAMIAVACLELIPEAAKTSKYLATIGAIAGFITMMVLDVALG